MRKLSPVGRAGRRTLEFYVITIRQKVHQQTQERTLSDAAAERMAESLEVQRPYEISVHTQCKCRGGIAYRGQNRLRLRNYHRDAEPSA